MTQGNTGRKRDGKTQQLTISSEVENQIFDNRIGRCKVHGLDPYLSPKEAADFLGVSARFIYERIATREVESQPIGRLRRIRLSTLEKWLIRQQNGEVV